ncbi:class I SAM-dependent methyltransferase [Desertimonas flava]|uniref:class I SAM-dependent methyltransferase n=1 Tax=Desertimonas flava TaxID=2064846 RepID=UPI000E3483F8|nr:class I SAM-dependent methyltransferase [Desertimonas flava]
MANEQMRDYWASIGAEGWVRHKHIFDSELAPFAAAVLENVRPGPRDRLLDIGCGTGTLLHLAAESGASGQGVDISPAMIEAATSLVPSATFVVADAQTDPLGGPFSAMISRFGVMFFEDPVAAFANIRRAVEADGRLAFVCWRGLDENPMFSLGTSVLLDRIDPRPPGPVDGAPGPLGFADPDRIRSVLTGSGWADVSVEPFDAMCDYGRDGTDGVENRLTMILGTSAGSMASANVRPQIGEEAWAALLDDVRAELRANLVDGRVQFNGATWLVTARNPG